MRFVSSSGRIAVNAYPLPGRRSRVLFRAVVFLEREQQRGQKGQPADQVGQREARRNRRTARAPGRTRRGSSPRARSEVEPTRKADHHHHAQGRGAVARRRSRRTAWPGCSTRTGRGTDPCRPWPRRWRPGCRRAPRPRSSARPGASRWSAIAGGTAGGAATITSERRPPTSTPTIAAR